MTKRKIFYTTKGLVIYECCICHNTYISGVVANPEFNTPTFKLGDEVCMKCLEEFCELVEKPAEK